jgi:hypothetical protein
MARLPYVSPQAPERRSSEYKHMERFRLNRIIRVADAEAYCGLRRTQRKELEARGHAIVGPAGPGNGVLLGISPMKNTEASDQKNW